MGGKENLAELVMRPGYLTLADCGGWKNSPLGVAGFRSSIVGDCGLNST